MCVRIMNFSKDMKMSFDGSLKVERVLGARIRLIIQCKKSSRHYF
jgi:hypothetical protein